MLLCKFCNKECKNDNSLRNHQRLCKSNPVAQSTSEALTKAREVRRLLPPSNQYIKGTAKPLSAETRKKMSEASKNIIWTEERKSKHSLIMRKAVLENSDSYTSSNVCGRVKVEEYKGEKFHGKWEIEVAKWLDANGIKWDRKVEPIDYFWNNKIHLYYPDFYLPELNLYIEVKGYETERDRCKWSALSNLVIIKKSEIALIRENKYTLR